MVAGRPKTLTCAKGHPWVEETTTIQRRGPNSTRRICQTCVNARANAWLTARYRTDPIWREKMKALSRARYYAKRSPNVSLQTGLTPSQGQDPSGSQTLPGTPQGSPPSRSNQGPR